MIDDRDPIYFRRGGDFAPRDFIASIAVAFVLAPLAYAAFVLLFL